MSAYKFRLRFHLRTDDSIALDEEEIEITTTTDGAKWKLKSGAVGTPISAHSRAAVIGGPYETPEAAREAGRHARVALLIWAVTNRVGLDPGDGKLRSSFSDSYRDYLEAQYGHPVRNDIHGLDVFPSDPSPVFVSFGATGKLRKSGQGFLDQLAALIHAQGPISEKQSLSLELFALSYFETSHRARFLTLVTCVEALLEPAPRSHVAQEFVTKTQDEVEQLNLDAATKKSMRSSLEWLKSESIGQSGRALVERHLGSAQYDNVEAKRFFSRCYGVRSEILHNGSPSDAKLDLLDMTNTLQDLVRDLLLKLVGGLDASPR
jgi:hypothetical protein